MLLLNYFMFKKQLLLIGSLAILANCLLTNCQTTYSGLSSGGGYSSRQASRPVAVVEAPETLVASASMQPAAPVTTSNASDALAKASLHAARPAAGLQMSAPDTVVLAKQPAAKNKFGVTQGAHIAGGALVLAGGITTVSGLNSNEPGWEPFAIVVLGLILAIVGGAMLLFKGKTAHRRQKQA
jgi:hypothetical protein